MTTVYKFPTVPDYFTEQTNLVGKRLVSPPISSLINQVQDFETVTMITGDDGKFYKVDWGNCSLVCESEISDSYDVLDDI